MDRKAEARATASRAEAPISVKPPQENNHKPYVSYETAMLLSSFFASSFCSYDRTASVVMLAAVLMRRRVAFKAAFFFFFWQRKL